MFISLLFQHRLFYLTVLYRTSFDLINSSSLSLTVNVVYRAAASGLCIKQSSHRKSTCGRSCSFGDHRRLR
jgi:hypothetical protein